MVGSLSKTPNAVVCQSTGSGMIGFPHAMRQTGKTAIEGSEIQGSILHGGTAHHHLRTQSSFGSIETRRLARCRIVCHDARIVGTAPEIAVQILRNGTNIAQRNGIEFGGRCRIIVYSILVGTHPESIVVIHVQLRKRIVGDRPLVVRIVHKLAADFLGIIQINQAVMVGGNPHVSLLVSRHITDNDFAPRISRHIKAEGGQIALRPDKPFLQILMIHIDAQIGIHPIVVLAVYEGEDRMVGRESVVKDKTVHPHHLLGIAIQSADHTIDEGYHRLSVVLADTAHLIIRQRTA